ncbi:hypothetical protein NFI96_008393 [Prochilodus magdalenae]|nr:hypothetical protein NFI96_008393 [Prochilodus magdalenae]
MCINSKQLDTCKMCKSSISTVIIVGDVADYCCVIAKLDDGVGTVCCYAVVDVHTVICRLAGFKFTMNSCETICAALKSTNSPLKELDLSNTGLQDSEINLLSAALKSSNCKLELLRLAGCKLTMNSCKTLCAALKSANSPLKELDLSNSDLEDSGVNLLSARLQSLNCKLEILRLSGCMVTEKGCSYLASALSENPTHLKELDLSYNHPGDTGVKLLSARLEDPDCRLDTLRMDHGGKIRMKPGIKKYSCELTLDPNTAHRRLSLCEENRKVVWVKEDHSYPDHPERFDVWEQVLCRESLTGRCYWEAEWSGNVEIAVTYKGIIRKGGWSDCLFGLNVKSWSLSCYNNSYSVRHNKNITDLSAPSSQSNRVGVYLDCPAGTLSFYSVSTDTAGTGRLVANEGKMNAAKYRDILEENLFKSALDLRLGRKFTFHQDNDLWRDLKMAVHQCSPSNLKELERICKEEWQRIPKSCYSDQTLGFKESDGLGKEAVAQSGCEGPDAPIPFSRW